MRKRLDWLWIALVCVVLTVVIFRGGWGMVQIDILPKKNTMIHLWIYSHVERCLSCLNPRL